jgi:hypothetical protein
MGQPLPWAFAPCAISWFTLACILADCSQPLTPRLADVPMQAEVASLPPPWSPTARDFASPTSGPIEATQAPTPTPPRFHVASAEGARFAFVSSSVRTLNEIMNPDRTLALPESEPLLWGSGWCAASQEILDQNYQVMGTRLYVNGFEIDPAYYATRDYGSADPENPTFCRSLYILIDSWPSGMTLLEVRHAILEPLSDGWTDVAPGLIRNPFVVYVGPP